MNQINKEQILTSTAEIFLKKKQQYSIAIIVKLLELKIYLMYLIINSDLYFVIKQDVHLLNCSLFAPWHEIRLPQFLFFSGNRIGHLRIEFQ